MQVYIVQVTDGQPDWDTAQPFDEIKTVEVNANDINNDVLSLASIEELFNESREEDDSKNYVELRVPEITAQRLKQHHYDETHSRKANWSKRYF